MNPNRPRGTGKGTKRFWQHSMEGGSPPGLPVAAEDRKLTEQQKKEELSSTAVSKEKEKVGAVDRSKRRSQMEVNPEWREKIEEALKKAIESITSNIAEYLSHETRDSLKAKGIDFDELQKEIKLVSTPENIIKHIAGVEMILRNSVGSPDKQEESKEREMLLLEVAETLMELASKKEENLAKVLKFSGGIIGKYKEVPADTIQDAVDGAVRSKRVESSEDKFNEDEKRFLNLYLKKYQEKIVSFFELVKSDEEIEKFKKSLLYNIKETRGWAITRGFQEKKADILKERLEKDVMDFFRETAVKEKPFTPEQMNELRDLLAVAKKYAEKAEQSELRKMVEDLITEELIPEGLFARDDVSKAGDYVMKWVGKLSSKK